MMEQRGVTTGEIERRTIASEATLEYREDPRTGEKTPVITGYAAVFNSESRNLGGFVEVLEPRSFDKVLRSNPDVVCVWNHNKDAPLGRIADGRLRLSADEYGLRYEVTPDTDTSVGKDVTIWVKNRTVQASSFAFAVNRDGGESWEAGPSGLRLRRIKEVALLDDVSPVLRPAYDATSVVVSRRALEMAVGEANRPNQTMSNAAKRGLKAAAGRSDVDPVALALAERIAERQILAADEIPWAIERLDACLEARSTTWAGTAPWITYQLLGGDSGERWLRRRAEEEPTSAVMHLAGASQVTGDEAPEERADGIDLRPTAAMAAAARRGLKLHEEGRSGDGLKPETVARAKRIAARETLTPSHVREMRAWFRRHKVDRRPGWDKPGDETPGYTAWLLWGGAPAWRWSEAKVSQMERATGERATDEAEMYAAFIETTEECREWTAALFAEDPEYREDAMSDHPDKIRALYRAMADIEEQHGAWSRDDEKYMEAWPYAGRGMYCRMAMKPLDDGDDKEPDGDPDDAMKPAKRSDDEPIADEGSKPADPPPQKREDSDVIAAIAAMDAAVLATHLHGAQSAE